MRATSAQSWLGLRRPLDKAMGVWQIPRLRRRWAWDPRSLGATHLGRICASCCCVPELHEASKLLTERDYKAVQNLNAGMAAHAWKREPLAAKGHARAGKEGGRGASASVLRPTRLCHTLLRPRVKPEAGLESAWCCLKQPDGGISLVSASTQSTQTTARRPKCPNGGFESNLLSPPPCDARPPCS